MRKLTISMWTVFIIAAALWMFPPNVANADRGATSVKASAHVAGIVVGKPVHSERNVLLGTVENIVLNDSGCAKYLVITGKFSGARSRLYPIPWTVIARSAPDVIFVRVDEQVLTKGPSFEVNRWPDFSQSEWENRIQTFYRDGAQATVTEKKQPEKPTAGVRSEEKSKAEPGVKERGRDWGKKATEGKGAAEEKGKSRLEREHKQKPAETGVGQSSEQKQMDLKTKGQTQHQKDKMMQQTPRMMEREQPKQMMERVPSQQQTDQGPPRMERGASKTMEKDKPEKGEAAPRGLH